MKRLFYMMTGVLSLFIIIGCSSKESKANKLIDEYMFKHLHDYKSYEAVETKIDTLYNLPITDDSCYDAAVQIVAHSQNASQYENEQKNVQRFVDIWDEGGRLPSFREQAKEAQIKSFEATKNQCIENIEVLKYSKVIVEKLPMFDGKKQVGWLVNHSFRSNNRGGNSSLETCTFLIDKRFKKIIRALDIEDKGVQEAIHTLSIAKDFPSAADIDNAINQYNNLIGNLDNSIKEFKSL